MRICGVSKKYLLKHIGASAINNQTGKTVSGLCAVEFSEEYCTWEKPQAVLILSRTRQGTDTIISGNKELAINKMWELITLGNQFTPYIEDLLTTLSVNSSSERVGTVVNYTEMFPYRTCGIFLPTDSSGYIYFLVSVKYFQRDCIGKTQNIYQRLNQNTSGYGVEDTAEAIY